MYFGYVSPFFLAAGDFMAAFIQHQMISKRKQNLPPLI